jgi:LPXTG-site transpeptidase (sortase) family protein
VSDRELVHHRAGLSRRWVLILVAAMVGMVVSVAIATGAVGGSPKEATVDRPTESTSPEPGDPVAGTKAEILSMPESVPVRLRVPGIDVDSKLMDLGLERDGSLETPPGGFPAGWFTGAPTPGEVGPAIIVGHVRYETPGVFARLTELRRGDKIMVNRKDRTTATFRVTRLARFAKSEFPTKQVYGNIDHAGLRLITCGGLDANTNEFDENVVVFAELVRS